MIVKTFSAKDIREGKKLVVEELGENAVILSTRTTKKNGEKNVEITAALDEAYAKRLEEEKKERKRQLVERLNEIKKEKAKSEFDKIKEYIDGRFDEIKFFLNEISNDLKFKYDKTFSIELKNLFYKLRKNEYSENFAYKIIGQLSTKTENNERSLEELARDLIVAKFKFSAPIRIRKRKQIFTFIGPTGSGKTLTLSKLAITAKYALKARIAIVSADSEKIGGAEQLQSYAAVADSAFYSVYSPKELKQTIKKIEDVDFVFVDTTGRSPNDSVGMKEIQAYLEAAESDRTFLTYDCSRNYSYNVQALRAYLKLEPTSLVLTKLDEAAAIGGLVEALDSFSLPISYLCSGQKTPEDIELASPDFLAKFVVQEFN